MKYCRSCDAFKDTSKFGTSTRTKDGLYTQCKACVAKKRKEWLLKNPNNARNRQLKTVFGITLEEYEDLFLLQNGLCVICGRPETTKHQNGKVKRLAVDHCHKTGKIRGLLCMHCNKALGAFGDNCETLKRAIAYLTYEGLA